MVSCIEKNNIYNEYYGNPSAFYQWHLVQVVAFKWSE